MSYQSWSLIQLSFISVEKEYEVIVSIRVAMKMLGNLEVTASVKLKYGHALLLSLKFCIGSAVSYSFYACHSVVLPSHLARLH